MGDLGIMANNREHVTKKYTTGKGELTGFIAVIEPSTKYNKEGDYTANILLSKEEGEKLAEEIKSIRTEQYKTYGKGTKVAEITQCIPYGTVNAETGEETPDPEGRYILKTKAKAKIEGGKPRFKIPVFNAKGQPIKALNIGAGTIACLSTVLSGYSVAGKTGVSVQLNGVQIIDLVEYQGGASFEGCGFTSQEGYDGVGEEFTEETTYESDEEEAEEEEF